MLPLPVPLCCRLLRQVTLAETDVEGSTELMEGDPLLMTHCQEIHDNIMRWLISWWVAHCSTCSHLCWCWHAETL
jgi:hypothetical protein